MSGLTWKNFVFPLLSGMCMGLRTMFYFFAIEWADASKVIGIEAVYPLFVALWSYIFLNEKIKSIAYLGIGFAVLGGVILSADAFKLIYKAILANTASCQARNEEFLENERRTEEEINQAHAQKMEIEGYGECWYPFKEMRLKRKREREERAATFAAAVAANTDSDSEKDPLLKKGSGDERSVNVDIHGSIPSMVGSGNAISGSINTYDGGSYDDIDEAAMIEAERKRVAAMSSLQYFKKVALGIFPLPILLSGNDFFAKLSVEKMHRNNVSGLNSVGLGLVLACMLFKKDVRKHYLDELKFSWLFCAIIEALSISATYLLICGMMYLSAPIVSSLSASRPLFILFFETVFRISKVPVSHCLGFKLFPILCVIVGTVIMTLYA